MSILIVDDSKMNIKVAEDALKIYQPDQKILTCLSGKEALEILNHEPIDLILLDIVMPEMSGIDLLKRLNAMNKIGRTKVIMLTTVDDYLVLKESFDLGATDYINKPFNKIEFSARVQSVLNEIHSERQLEKALILMEKQNDELLKVNRSLKEAQNFLIEKEKAQAVNQMINGIAEEMIGPLENFDRFVTRSKSLVESLNEDMSTQALLNTKSNMLENFLESSKELKEVNKLIRSLKNFSPENRLEHLGPARVSDLLDETLLAFKKDLSAVKTIDKRYGDPSLIVCHKIEVKKAFVHIIKNALEALSEVEDSCLSLRTIENDEHVVCIISDNGPGIKSEIKEKITDPFFTTKTKSEHLGIGLSIVYDSIVKKQEGQVMFDANKEGGLAVTIVLNK